MTARLRRYTVLAFAAGAVSAACSVLNEPEPSVRVTVADTVYTFPAYGGSVDLSLSFAIQNAGTINVRYMKCGTGLVRWVGDQSIGVWSSICFASNNERVVIAPGEEYTGTVRITAKLGSGLSKLWQEPIAGDYRLGLALSNGQEVIPLADRFSNTFRLEAR